MGLNEWIEKGQLVRPYYNIEILFFFVRKKL